ncbi:hypothetical protein BU24DRAFT_467209 [Aaosphaeria arxii CBS 175.79]|uniref:Uncharacterized protein n=1 Tax=Aaosphaeria arxii CBS 175.79 TaxID=1450172 RepID=A0A6A5XCH7_9PLEO|nr:uncharacterized protein BU24DRAFT_467209 [Aaosphaeria arxii CBS 175.79]KAF2010593.1 hypothetical protein BU24DRAFT_467209 [Aaosphaeria arxii CBS 175.79]
MASNSNPSTTSEGPPYTAECGDDDDKIVPSQSGSRDENAPASPQQPPDLDRRGMEEFQRWVEACDSPLSDVGHIPSEGGGVGSQAEDHVSPPFGPAIWDMPATPREGAPEGTNRRYTLMSNHAGDFAARILETDELLPLLKQLKATSANRLPPARPNRAGITYMDLVIKRLLRIGDIIKREVHDQELQPWHEMALWRYLAERYWPVPGQQLPDCTYPHIRVREYYQNERFFLTRAGHASSDSDVALYDTDETDDDAADNGNHDSNHDTVNGSPGPQGDDQAREDKGQQSSGAQTEVGPISKSIENELPARLEPFPRFDLNAKPKLMQIKFIQRSDGFGFSKDRDSLVRARRGRGPTPFSRPVRRIPIATEQPAESLPYFQNEGSPKRQRLSPEQDIGRMQDFYAYCQALCFQEEIDVAYADIMADMSRYSQEESDALLEDFDKPETAADVGMALLANVQSATMTFGPIKHAMIARDRKPSTAPGFKPPVLVNDILEYQDNRQGDVYALTSNMDMVRVNEDSRAAKVNAVDIVSHGGKQEFQIAKTEDLDHPDHGVDDSGDDDNGGIKLNLGSNTGL